MQIHHIVLKRVDGSELRRNFVAVAVDAPPVRHGRGDRPRARAYVRAGGRQRSVAGFSGKHPSGEQKRIPIEPTPSARRADYG